MTWGQQSNNNNDKGLFCAKLCSNSFTHSVILFAQEIYEGAIIMLFVLHMGILRHREVNNLPHPIFYFFTG